MEMIFQFAESAHLGGDPQQVGEKLHQIRARKKLTPAVVVEEARPRGSVLHRYFDWDNDKAAEKWRLVQARDLIQAVVTVKVDDEVVAPVRSFISIDQAYEPSYAVMSDTQLRQKALEDVQRSIESLKEKVKAYEELHDVLQALERVQVVTQRHLPRRTRQAPARRGVAATAR